MRYRSLSIHRDGGEINKKREREKEREGQAERDQMDKNNMRKSTKQDKSELRGQKREWR